MSYGNKFIFISHAADDNQILAVNEAVVHIWQNFKTVPAGTVKKCIRKVWQRECRIKYGIN